VAKQVAPKRFVSFIYFVIIGPVAPEGNHLTVEPEAVVTSKSQD
jgi:hypothetical protein